MKKGYTLMELLVVVSIIAFMAIVSVPAFAQYGRSSDFKQKSDEVKMLMQRTYLLSRSPENTNIQYYRLRVDNQIFKLESTVKSMPSTDADWTIVDQIKKLDDGTNGLTQNLENVQCDNPTGDTGCVVLTCSTNPQEKCNINTTAVLPLTTLRQITFIDNKISGFNNLATYSFEGVTKNDSDITSYKAFKPFSVTVTYSR